MRTQEEKNAYNRRWYQRNLERNRERGRIWARDRRQRDPEALRAYGRLYYARNREKEIEKARLYRKNNHEKHRVTCAKSNRKCRFGITQDVFLKLIAAQGNKCAICRKVFVKTPVIDHCHKANHVRGLLCSMCNTSLGGFRDSPSILLRAYAYISKEVLFNGNHD